MLAAPADILDLIQVMFVIVYVMPLLVPVARLQLAPAAPVADVATGQPASTALTNRASHDPRKGSNRTYACSRVSVCTRGAMKCLPPERNLSSASAFS